VHPGGGRTGRACAALALLAAIALLPACGGGAANTIAADGSSTVGPYLTAAAELYRDVDPETQITVGISGTGGGFERFCRGETDISNASRPIDADEAAICEQNAVEYLELHIANDALTVIANRDNDWATCLTVEELAAIWGPGSDVTRWSQVRDGFPDDSLRLFGPGTDSGTFDYFTSVINGDEGASRTDYSPSEDDNVIVQGVAGERGGLGYLGFSYFDENRGRLKALDVDAGGGCVAPSVATSQDSSYTPLSRPLLVYVKQSSLQGEEVAAFIRFVLENERAIADRADFIPLNGEQLAKAESDLDAALAETAG
jgi:phosphate transport system substrate-binding protein